VEAVTTGDRVAAQLALDARVAVADGGRRDVHAHVVDLEMQGRARVEPRGDQVRDHLGLPVDRDRAAGQRAQVDAVLLAVEREAQPVVHQALAFQARAEAGVAQRVGRPLLQHAGADPPLDVLAAARLEHDGVDARAVQQVAEEQPRGSGSDDRDLRALGHPRRT